MIYKIHNDLVAALRPLGKKVFLDRPKNLASEQHDFIVVKVATSVRSMIMGGINVYSECFGTFTVYCKAKSDGTLNIGAQSELTQQVIDLFPIVGESISAVNPTILMQGEDGYGFHATQITFRIRYKQ
jgi:hypothetical protein